ncbi:MAG TPA: NUDIX domain-containing protein [Chloroflexota bacterium]
MAKQSAGLLLYRVCEGEIEVFLVHPGGPFWAKKDLGAWSIPKGEFDDHEDGRDAARREFEEETGFTVPGELMELGARRQAGGKVVHAWTVQGDCDPTGLISNTFPLEWPPKSGRIQQFPEVDRAGWFDLDSARTKLNPGQVGFLDDLPEVLRLDAS